MLEPSGETGVVHKSAHPSLPPAAPQQVVQYLLAKNYHLTALELLVEAQQAGHGDDLRDLQAFFSDPDRFPPDELARHQPGNALELQAAGRERESRLQLAEYELRLAKEDLAEMSRKLAAAQQQAAEAAERQQQQQAASPMLQPSLSGAPPSAAVANSISPAARSTALHPSPARSPHVAGSGGLPSAAEQQALNEAVFAHLQRQGLITTAMTMEEEYGGPLRPQAGQGQSPGGVMTHGSPHVASADAVAADQWELWRWYQAAVREASGVGFDYSSAAMSLALSPAVSAGGAEGVTAAAAVGGAGGGDVLGPELGSLMNLDLDSIGLEELLLEGGGGGGGDGGGGTAVADGAQEEGAPRSSAELKGRLLAARERLVAAAEQVKKAAAVVARQQQQQQQVLRSPLPPPPSPAPPQFGPSDPALRELLELSAPATRPGSSSTASTTTTTTASAAAFGSPAEEQPLSSTPTTTTTAAAEPPAPDGSFPAAAASSLQTHGSLAAATRPPPPPAPIDPAYHASLESLRSQLAEALPRLLPGLTLRSRLEVLPLLESAARVSPDWEVRRQLLAAAFNAVPAPDPQQRQAILDCCLQLCRHFGPAWAAAELLPLASRAAGQPSAERRTLVAEVLGAAAAGGAVEAGSQAHALVAQLAQLARDRMEQVREAACRSLAQLAPRLPFSRSYSATLESLLLALATDPAEPVAQAALQQLVPALLGCWQPPAAHPTDGECVLVSSVLARVMSDIGKHVRHITEQQQQQLLVVQQQQQKAAADAAAAAANAVGSSGGGFAGSILRYGLAGVTHQQQQQPPPAAAAAPPSTTTTPTPSDGGSGSGGSFPSGMPPQPRSPAPPLPPPRSPAHPLLPHHHPPTSQPPPAAAPQPVSYGRRTFPSASHLALQQLLGLLAALAPALRHAALCNRPAWASAPPPTSVPHSSLPARPLPAAPTSTSTSRHHRSGSAAPATALPRTTTGSAGDLPSAANATTATSATTTAASPHTSPGAARQGAGLLQLPSHAAAATGGHRRSSSHPALPSSASAGSSTRPHPQHQQSPVLSALTLLRDTPRPPGETPPPPPPPQQQQTEADAEAGGLRRRVSGAISEVDGVSVVSASEEGGEASQAEAASREGGEAEGGEGEGAARAEEDAVLGMWAEHPAHESWKTLEWVMQLVVPELLRVCGCLGPPAVTTAAAAGGGEVLEVRRAAAGAVEALCEALGAPFTRTAILPVFLAASGTAAELTAAGVVSSGGGGGGGGGTSIGDVIVPLAVQDVVAAWQPRQPEALRTARQCVLPVLLASVLPACGQLEGHLEGLMGAAHEMRHRWLMGALQDYTAALTLACVLRPALLAPLLRLFEDLLSGASTARMQLHARNQATRTPNGIDGGGAGGSDSGRGTPTAAPAPAAAAAPAGPASTAVGLCCTALARSLVPLATLEMASRRLLPGLMALMSYGEPELQRACVGVLAELGLRFRGDGPRVSEQVLAVYDSLLEQGSHAVQLEVLAAGTALAAAAAPSAAVSAAAAAQVEWLLMAVQSTAMRLAAAAASPGGGATPEQLRSVAAQLLAAMKTVVPHDLRLPRLQTNVASALDALARCKTLLPDPQQQAALAALLKERPTGQSTAGPSISSTSTSAPPPPTSNPAVAPSVASFTPLRLHPQPSPAASPLASLAGSLTMGSAVLPLPPGGALHQPHPQPHLPASPAGAAAGSAHAEGQQGGAGGGQLRSRFDAFKLRLMKRKDEPAAAPQQHQQPGGSGAGGRPKDNFFSDDEGE